MSEIIIDNNNFEKEVLNSDKPVLVDFWASWCSPCSMLSPIISQIAEECKDTVKVCKVNVDDNYDLAVKYGITNIPAVLLFKNGSVKDMSVGFVPKNKILQMIK